MMVGAGRRGNQPRANQLRPFRAVSPRMRPRRARQAGWNTLVMARIVARLSRPYLCHHLKIYLK
jgi:hypothetical protein